MLKQRIIALLVVTSIVASSLLPIYPPKKAHALFGIGDIVIDVKAAFDRVADAAAQVFAQKLINDIVNSTVRWANSGFEGNPAYVTDFEGFITKSADKAAGEFIAGSDVGFLCSPLQNVNIKLSLQRYYTETYEDANQCTLSQIGVNVDNFIEDFDQGGWEAWFAMTQNPSNNPYGAFVEAQIELDSRIAQALNIDQTKLNWNQGFRSKGDCLVRNEWPPHDVISEYEYGDEQAKEIIEEQYPNWNPYAANGECLAFGPDKTPGSIIKSQLDQVLPSGLNKLITAEHWDQVLNAFLNGLLQRYVFGDSGLFSNNHSDYLDNPPPPITRPPEYETTLDCFVSTGAAFTGESVTWTAIGGTESGTTYTWSGEGVGGQNGQTVSVAYSTPGSKSASVTATWTENGLIRSATSACASISVTEPPEDDGDDDDGNTTATTTGTVL